MVKLNKIYTRTGDDGTTGLVDGSRRAKHDARMEAIGAVDEANSALGLLAVSLDPTGSPASVVARILNDLFDLGADLATPGDDFTPSEMVLRIVPAQAEWLEAAIDGLNEHLAPLTSFILPGGSEAAARAHIARAAVRRAERAATALAAVEPVNPAALAYLNRLSDYLFVLARALNAAGAGDVLWVPGQNR
ncbi:cob(I)yrinic acid a,c-diamide adenosyltransferase [Novosphingobium sp.]|uniref:cob(I)yrinic acid a,c-diamide adenosyltransferase n=1 Tax=Novosphingobium sp. TaxID=1874826 RepID=UPI0022C6F441|nr:cob(I)yrinic acid a,c-diamide adenosyltransferase [Novosphingobium sp.]MCZ8019260.1 cob(I)yrinic acid a,c-diamide adenosyltransferase [Novosphingobium sp.]MCZ8035068.1 cob(I)yrinic acid a,c-diamide adenosyltransferase [Novosphingobium sp.]MCZ8052636.1 cob(I)yrinic acid a,c-diamide adenosyltransferase [Novosphingobium sp.]MCZ8058735.1 cob(I)yrinic acid a,c-diamide adenosyltransferase [Novosphingobium sp.]MCZ8233132.1 cob(I)yrinic acid a,c-diamide adenosyltransferase [Novosphingobium sp.]